MDERLGRPVPGWTARPVPGPGPYEGRFVRLERLSVRHAQALYAAYRGADAVWDYLPYGPFAEFGGYEDWVRSVEGSADPMFFALLVEGRAVGVASWLRIAPEAGSIEVGHINLSPLVQKTPAATEAMYLMMREAFALGYRRYEWKCNALNLGSRRAAQRLGLSFEGVFRQHLVVKGRNRDTAWFAATDGDWTRLGPAMEAWLASENFDAAGRQKVSLAAMTGRLLVARDPAV